MSPYVHFGRFVYGETGADIIVRFKREDGTVVDVTNASAITLLWRTQDGQTGTISGSVVTPGTDGKLRFEDPGNVLQPASIGATLTLDFIVRCTISSETVNTRQVGRYEILRWS